MYPQVLPPSLPMCWWTLWDTALLCSGDGLYKKPYPYGLLYFVGLLVVS